MTAKEKLRERLAETPDEGLARLEALMEDALPRKFRASRTLRLTEAVLTDSTRLGQEIDDLSEEDAREILDYLDWVDEGIDTLSDEEVEAVRKGQAEIASGEYVTLEDLRRRNPGS